MVLLNENDNEIPITILDSGAPQDKKEQFSYYLMQILQ